MPDSSTGDERMDRHQEDIEREAAEWFALLRDGAASAETKDAFKVWRDADTRHAAAFADVLSIWDEVGALEEFANAPKRPVPASARNLRSDAKAFAHVLAPSPLGVGLAAIAALCVIAAIAWRMSSPSSHDYATRIAETEHIALPDGSAVDLGPKSRIRVSYTSKERRIALEEGEAFFDVRKGDSRSFIVAANGAEVRVTGTQFNVREGAADITVAVAEGNVEVRRKSEKNSAPTADAIQTLSAGQQVSARQRGGDFGKIIETPTSSIGAWRTGRLSYNNVPLREVIADANRYSHTPIVIADAKLIDLKVVASFRAVQIDEMIEDLPATLPLRVDRSNKDSVILRAVES
ncbi:MAG: FecR domain-containing protein [Parvularculaceae bacterium]